MKKKVVGLALGMMMLGMTGMASATSIAEVEPNNSLATAQNVDAYFSLDYNPIIWNSTMVPNVSITGTGSADGEDRDYFSFTVTTPGGGAQFGLFDIDYGMYDLDSWIQLYDPTGNIIGANDDGWAGDAGSSHGYDSYLGYSFNTSGVYTIAVGRYPGLAGMSSYQDYVLNISVEGHSDPNPVPEPATLLLLGGGLMGLAFARRKS